MSGIYTEHTFKIYDNSLEDCFIKVSEDPDGLRLVNVSVSKSGEDNWGVCKLTMNKATVTALIDALQRSLEFAE